MFITVNGESHEHSGNGSITALLGELGATPEHSAVTVNGELIYSKNWPACRLSTGDKIEVLTFVGGG
ncbi:MAG: sulfur carrier protein ThiS [Kiritimatiellales bacterium]